MRHALALLVLVLLATAALGDGKMFQRAFVATSPNTPDQRALVAFDAARGVETLVIETTVAGDGDEFAWVVPLPAQPEIEASTKGLFPTLGLTTAPNVERRGDALWLCGLLLAIGLWGAMRWQGRGLNTTGAVSLPYVAFFLCILVVCVASPPGCSLSSTVGASVGRDGAQVLARKSVGVFDTTTLTATDAPSLRRWLTDNGFAAPEAIDPVVTDLLREGWVFVASRVRVEERVDAGGGSPTPEAPSDTSAPSRVHPLVFTFPTREAVYPMRLTGVGADSIELELFVCGANRAEADGLVVEYCRDGLPDLSPGDYHEEFARRVAGTEVLTKLSGRLEAADMTRDVHIRWTPYAPERTTWYRPVAALSSAASAGAAVFLALLVGAAVASRWIASCRTRRFTAFDAASFAVATLVSATAGIVLYVGLPLVPDGAVLTSPPDHELAAVLADPPVEVAGDVAALRDWGAAVTTGLTNAVTGEPVREEDSPGNWWVREVGERLEIVLWKAHGGMVVEQTIDVSSRVTFEGSIHTAEGAPVAGAKVRMRDASPWDRSNRNMFRAEPSFTTDADGRFRAHVLPGRRWDVYVAPHGHPYEFHDDLDPATTPMDFVLPRETSLRGRLVDSNGRPVAGATITGRVETPFCDFEERAVETDRDGWFEIPGLDAEAHEVQLLVSVHAAPNGLSVVEKRFRGGLPPTTPFVLVTPSEPAR